MAKVVTLYRIIFRKGMMHRLSIGAIMVSIASLIVFSAWPHHHHKGLICMKVEMCMHDHSLNDRHTSHHAESTGERHCMAETNLHSLKASDNTGSERLSAGILFLLCCFAVLCGLFRLWRLLTGKRRAAHTIGFASATLGRHRGLRAPPAFVC